MSRASFGLWGTSLSDDDFARALAAAGVLQAALDPFASPTKGLLQALASEEFLRWNMPRHSLSSTVQEAHVAALARSWADFKAATNPPRLCLNAAGDITEPIMPWIVNQLQRGAVGANSVFFELTGVAHPAWNWPVQIGVFPGRSGEYLIDRLHQFHTISDYKVAHVYELSRNRPSCDILVLTESTPLALKRVLASSLDERARVVIITGGGDNEWPRTVEQLFALQSKLGASGFVLIEEPPLDPGEFIGQLVDNLSHNEALDVAITKALRTSNTDNTEGLIALGRPLIARARLSESVHMLAKRLVSAGTLSVEVPSEASVKLKIHSAVSDAVTIGKKLESNWQDFAYLGEGHEATGLVRLHEAVEPVLNQQEAATAEARYLQAKVQRIEGGSIVLTEHTFRANTRHLMTVRVGPNEMGWINPKNNQAFPGHLLPQEEDSWTLQVVLSEPNHIPTPLCGTIELPRHGASNAATFEFVPVPSADPFNGRLMVLYRNRILQTAIVQGRVVTETSEERADDQIEIEIEAVVRPNFIDLGSRSHFDMALAFNHTPGGEPRMVQVAGDHATLEGLLAIKPCIDAIHSRLEDVAKDKSSYDKLDSAESQNLLRFLATNGRDLYDYLVKDQIHNDPLRKKLRQKATHIQIINLHADSYFPAELIYEFPVPTDSATLCLKGWKALRRDHRPKTKANGAVQLDECTHDVSPNPYICPLGFWGLSRVIERHTFPPQNRDQIAGDWVIQAEPIASRNRLEVLTEGLLGISRNVDEETPAESERLHRCIQQALGKPVPFVKNWTDWVHTIKKETPSIIVALPHTEGKIEYGKTLYYLEIGNDLLKTQAIDWTYVRAVEEARSPVVLLLGCDTVVARSSVDSIVGKFRRAGVPIVVGTIATVLGSHASQVTQNLVKQLSALGAREPRSFGEVVLEVRRRCVADGLVMALCVVAFGDADWKLGT